MALGEIEQRFDRGSGLGECFSLGGEQLQQPGSQVF
jgi:hypothetical protein